MICYPTIKRLLAVIMTAFFIGNAHAQSSDTDVADWVKYATNLSLSTMGRLHQNTGYDLRNWLSVNVGNWVATYCNNTKCFKIKEVVDYANKKGLEASGLDKEHPLVTLFFTNMKDRFQDYLNAYRAAILEKTQEYNIIVSNAQQEKPITGGMSKEDYDVLLEGMIFYAFCKDGGIDNADCLAIRDKIQEFIKYFNNKNYINTLYERVRSALLLLKQDPTKYDYEITRVKNRSSRTLNEMENLVNSKKPEF